MHTAKVEKRTYKDPGGWKRGLTGILLFFSCLLILSGLLRDNSGGVRLEVKVTPTPTVFGKVFDETPATREISVSARSWYAIQLGAFDNEASAQSLAQTYINRGAAGYVLKDSRFRVLAALYPTREEAQTVRQQLQSQHKIESYVYEVSLPEIVLNVSGKAGQLDALEAGFQFLNATLEKFCAISISMDKQDLRVEDEMARINEISSQAQTLQSVLSLRFTSTKYAAVDNLISLLGEITKSANAVSENAAKGTVALAAQMKYQTLSFLVQVEGYLSSFGQ